MCSPLELDRYIRRFVAARSIAGCFRFFTLTPVRFRREGSTNPARIDHCVNLDLGSHL
jgi:hypothetical protein